MKAFLDAAYERYAERYKADFGDGIPGVFFDEPYITAEPIPWTDDLSARFTKDKGYDLLTSLPLLVLRGGNMTVKVRCDFYDVVAALYEEAWFVQISGLVQTPPTRVDGAYRGARSVTPGSARRLFPWHAACQHSGHGPSRIPATPGRAPCRRRKSNRRCQLPP